MQPINDKDNNRNNNAIPRVLLTATSSGIGKTMITCGILKALKNRGLNCAAFKCGPDISTRCSTGKCLESTVTIWILLCAKEQE